jgi:4'-phosphopantetheinyl transferase
MPLLKINKNENNVLAVWSLEETFEDLSRLISLNEEDSFKLEKITSPIRKREFLTVRILLHDLLGFYPEIAHDQHRRPSLSNSGLNLSISHSRSLVTVILSENEVGIDTEENTRNVSQIAKRFLSEEELSWTSASEDPNNAWILCWSIKESVFKMMGIENVDFRTMIRIDPVKMETSGVASVTFRIDGKCEKIDAHYFREGNNIITWCTLPISSFEPGKEKQGT